jgi:hypothetical protein
MVKNTPLVYSTLHYVLSNIQYFYMFLLIIVTGADPGGGWPPKKKFGKNMIFWRKIVIFHTKYPKYFRASLRSAQFFWVRPLTWNPGSAAELGLDMVNQMAINGGIQDHEISQHLGMTFIIPFVMII